MFGVDEKRIKKKNSDEKGKLGSLPELVEYCYSNVM